jgi:hypothetical protein
LRHLHQRFPTIDRVTTYGRAATLARRQQDDLLMLTAAGLKRVHLGLESGSDEVLAQVCKGTTAKDLITAGRKVLSAGLELCFYVMPGLGGERLRDAHVRGTAAVIGAVASVASARRPLVVRLRTVALPPGTPLAEQERSGQFAVPDDVAIAGELHDLIEQTSEARFELRSDHALNLLPELEGSLPQDRARLLALLGRYLSLPAGERAEFALGARLGIYRRLDDLDDAPLRELFAAQVGPTPVPGDEAGVRDMLAAAGSLRSRFI